MKRAASIVMAAALSACAPSFPEHPAAEDVLAALDKPWIGRESIERSLGDDGNEEKILGGICTATPPWIDVAHRLYDTGGAHWSEELASALSVALTKQPKLVLRRFDAGEVCGAPEHLPPSCAVPDWRDAALRALTTVNEPALAVARQQCEDAVRHAFIPAPDEAE